MTDEKDVYPILLHLQSQVLRSSEGYPKEDKWILSVKAPHGFISWNIIADVRFNVNPCIKWLNEYRKTEPRFCGPGIPSDKPTDTDSYPYGSF